ncbi:hypothetical protein P691DRAFT_503790 [Macrolepiota fuliginosa MF-IS2]|uniref:Uncharacterized protein n=1 Tax=Macrolepiota fuliginosa MF-IS2 TaxID=1400762 RepID=A0A9P6BY71_9AGAR|nr:hypothetical protein P691DRAFT_503790 [Macrolepiota fuliginosa MF-IS2]
MPFVWVIASRPEAHLIGALRYLKENFQDHPADFLECEIPIDSDDAAQDVERYLHTEFTKIRKDNPDAFPHSTSTWPSEDDFLKVAGASSGLFVFASTVTKYISVDRPASRLKLITSLIDQCKLNSTRISSKPFTLLDMLYTQVMSDIPEDLLPVAKSLLGYFHLLTEQSLFLNGLVVACNILGLRQDEAYDALRKLHSVLSCPHPGNAEDHGIKFFHTSFSDFLFDRSRSQNYYVDLDQECTNIWRCYTRILKESCRADASALVPHCDSVTIHWAHMNGDSHLDRTRERLLWVAQHNYISLLVKYGHSWCTSCSSLRAARCLLIDAPELIDAFRSIHPILFYAVTKRTKGFVDWVDKHVRQRCCKEIHALN